MADAEAGDQGIDGADLNSLASAEVAQSCGLDMIVNIGHEHRQQGERLDDSSPSAGPLESLKQFLQDHSRRDYDVTTLQTGLKEGYFRGARRWAPAQRERPHARIDEHRC